MLLVQLRWSIPCGFRCLKLGTNAHTLLKNAVLSLLKFVHSITNCAYVSTCLPLVYFLFRFLGDCVYLSLYLFLSFIRIWSESLSFVNITQCFLFFILKQFSHLTLLLNWLNDVAFVERFIYSIQNVSKMFLIYFYNFTSQQFYFATHHHIRGGSMIFFYLGCIPLFPIIVGEEIPYFYTIVKDEGVKNIDNYGCYFIR